MWKIQKGSEPRNTSRLLQYKTVCMHTILWVLFMQDQQQDDSCTLGFTCINSTWSIPPATEDSQKWKPMQHHILSCYLIKWYLSLHFYHHPQGFAVHLFNFTCLLIFFLYFICSTSPRCPLLPPLPEHLGTFFTTLHFTTPPAVLSSEWHLSLRRSSQSHTGH